MVAFFFRHIFLASVIFRKKKMTWHILIKSHALWISPVSTSQLLGGWQHSQCQRWLWNSKWVQQWKWQRGGQMGVMWKGWILVHRKGKREAEWSLRWSAAQHIPPLSCSQMVPTGHSDGHFMVSSSTGLNWSLTITNSHNKWSLNQLMVTQMVRCTHFATELFECFWQLCHCLCLCLCQVDDGDDDGDH